MNRWWLESTCSGVHVVGIDFSASSRRMSSGFTSDLLSVRVMTKMFFTTHSTGKNCHFNFHFSKGTFQLPVGHLFPSRASETVFLNGMALPPLRPSFAVTTAFADMSSNDMQMSIFYSKNKRLIQCLPGFEMPKLGTKTQQKPRSGQPRSSNKLTLLQLPSGSQACKLQWRHFFLGPYYGIDLPTCSPFRKVA